MLNKIKEKNRTLLFFLIIFLLPTLARADSDQDVRALWALVGRWYTSFLLPLGTVLAGVVILIGGIMYISSAGDTSRTGRAKELIFGAIIGLIVLVGAALIIRTIIA